MPRGRARCARGCATLSRRTEDAGGAARYGRSFNGMSPAGSLIVGAIVLVPASLAADRSWTLHPLSCSLPARAASAFIIYFRLVQTLGSFGRRGAGLSARADQHRHGAARGISVGIGVARARVRRCRRGRDDVAVTTVRAAARLTPVTNPAAQQSQPSRCGQRSAISDQPVQPCPRAACIRPSTSPTNCRARRSEPSAHRRAARRSRPRTIRSSRSARRAPGRRARRGS